LIVVSRKLFEEKLTKADPFVRGLLKIFAENIRNLSSVASSKASGPASATGDEASAGAEAG
jgi:hypothetical protein